MAEPLCRWTEDVRDEWIDYTGHLSEAYYVLVLGHAKLVEERTDVPFAFNRKEAKDHGEGGVVVGGPLAGRVVIVDDGITDGAAKRESVELLRAHGATPVAVLIALDRVERGSAVTSGGNGLSSQSAVQAFEQEFGIPVISIANFGDLMQFLDSDSPLARDARAFRSAMEQYRATYGA